MITHLSPSISDQVTPQCSGVVQNIDKNPHINAYFLLINSSLFRFTQYPNQAESNMMQHFFRPSILLSTRMKRGNKTKL
ncbi:hypothetical protein VRK_37010 [Vibrio sp. MEBiC08052]|nr:hypothetical protein VRK_37010 [Vibrio sp. MEBiC08052]